MESSKTKWTDWLKAVFVVALAAILYRAIQSAGWIGGFNVRDEKLTLGISFLIGVAASLSSCLAVVGGMVIAFSEKYKMGSESSFVRGALLPNVKFHVGRIATFFVLGGLLGLVGGKINLGGNFVSIYTIIIAIVMGWLGLNILGLVPSISALGLKPPKFMLHWWGKLEDSEHKAAPYFLGGITFFLPCGFTQSMQIFALASGSFWTGSSVMLAFALGTMPILFGLGATASWANVKKISFINKAAGIIVILFAVYTLNSGIAIWGVKNDTLVNKKQIAANGGTPADAKAMAGKNVDANNNDSTTGNVIQRIEMKITSRGFEPSVLRIKNNIPVRFAVNGDEASGCTSRIVIPDFDIAKDIRKGENIIEFTPKKVGPIAFLCWMGMVRGKFIVEP